MKWGVRRAINKQAKASGKLYGQWMDYARNAGQNYVNTGDKKYAKQYEDGLAYANANMHVYNKLKVSDVKNYANRKEVKQFVLDQAAVGISSYRDSKTKEYDMAYLESERNKHIKRNEIKSDYQKKIRNSKTKDEREVLQLEAMDKLDKLA